MRPASRCSCSAAAATSWSATRASPAPCCGSRPRGLARPGDRRAGRWSPSRPARTGTALVEWSVAEKLAGIECLSGIPGLAGATPIQNVGAYGQEVAATISSVTGARPGDRLGHRDDRRSVPFRLPDQRVQAHRLARAGFRARVAGGGRAGPTGRYVVLDVTFALERDPMSAPVKYAELARKLAVEVGERAPLADVRAAVLDLRRGKGMVLDPADPDTVSAGSFFTNPVLGPAELARLERVAAARWPGTPVPTFPAGRGDGVPVGQGARRLADRAGRIRQGLPGPAERPGSPPSTRWR